MELLCDKSIVELLDRDNTIIENYEKPEDWYSKDSLVQPSSLDLHFGEIFLPDEKNCFHNYAEYSLPPGATVFVRTKEILKLPSNISAFGFPPTELSSKGILMTNPGHVDPGYRGSMSFTLINMGKKHFPIKKGNVVVSLLLIRLSKDCQLNYEERKQFKQSKTIKPLSTKSKKSDMPEQLSRLSRDFLNIEKRAKRIVKRRIYWFSFSGVVIGGVIGCVFPLAYNHLSDINKRVRNIEIKINLIEKERIIDSQELKIDSLKKQLSSHE